MRNHTQPSYASNVTNDSQKAKGDLSGTKSGERFQKFSGSWSKKQEPQRRSGSGKEVLLRILSVKVSGTGSYQYGGGRDERSVAHLSVKANGIEATSV